VTRVAEVLLQSKLNIFLEFSKEICCVDCD